jgi:hypothetical protein
MKTTHDRHQVVEITTVADKRRVMYCQGCQAIFDGGELTAIPNPKG